MLIPKCIDGKFEIIDVLDPWDCINNKLLWDIGSVDKNLIDWFNMQKIKPKTVLELGCGSGINSIWLSKQGCDVTAIDFHDSALSKTKQISEENKIKIDLLKIDLIKEKWPKKKFDFIFDRGCFHIFNELECEIYTSKLIECLTSSGVWLSLIGSKEQFEWFWSATKIINMVEPKLKILSLNKTTLETIDGHDVKAWALLTKRKI